MVNMMELKNNYSPYSVFPLTTSMYTTTQGVRTSGDLNYSSIMDLYHQKDYISYNTSFPKEGESNLITLPPLSPPTPSIYLRKDKANNTLYDNKDSLPVVKPELLEDIKYPQDDLRPSPKKRKLSDFSYEVDGKVKKNGNVIEDEAILKSWFQIDSQ